MLRLGLFLALTAVLASAYVVPDPPAFKPLPVLHGLAPRTRSPDSLFLTLKSEAMSCQMCKDLAALLGPVVRANLTLDVILEIGVPICAAVEASQGYPDCEPSTCPTLCKGLINEESVDVLSVALETVLSPPELCHYVGLCPAPPPPPTPSNLIPVKTNCSDHTGEKQWPVWNLTAGTGTFVHLTDIHTDLQYAPGTNSTCAMPICCRAQFGPGNATHSAGAWGDFACDPPVALVESLFAHIASLNPQPDFILYTGDDPAHDIWEQSRASNLASLDRVSALMAQYFPHIPVYSAIGNHEAYPVNQFQGPPGDFWLTTRVAADWAYYLTPNAQQTLAYGGYYTQRIRPGLRIISLNTNLYMNGDFWLVANHTDFTCQMNWLEDVLQQSEDLGEKCIIIAHAVCHSWFPDFCARYSGLVTRYRHTIVAMHHGHTHVSSATVFYDNSTGNPEPSHIAYMPGSVTMVYGVNPTFRIFEYDRSLSLPYLATDFTQYWVDVPTINQQPHTTPDWSVVRYQASTEYDLPDLSPKSWLDLAQRVLNNQTVFKQYLNNYSRGAPMKGPLPVPRDLYCELISQDSTHYHHCDDARLPGEPVRSDLPRPDFC